MKGMSYKGFWATVDYDRDDRILVGRIGGINDVIGFHADNVNDLIEAFHEAVDDYADACAKIGKKPDKSYSGSLMVRIDPAVHAQAARAAELFGKGLAQWAEERLREAARRDVGEAASA